MQDTYEVLISSGALSKIETGGMGLARPSNGDFSLARLEGLKVIHRSGCLRRSGLGSRIVVGEGGVGDSVERVTN